MLPDEVRLACLLERLRELERREVPEHERPIVEVGRATLREAIREVSHRLHDADYLQRAGAAPRRAPRALRNGARPTDASSIWRQLHDEADIPPQED
jgi:hypothetical protein